MAGGSNRIGISVAASMAWRQRGSAIGGINDGENK